MWLADITQTISDEVDAIWASQFSSTSVLYFFNRYGTLLSLILQFIGTRRGRSTNLS